MVVIHYRDSAEPFGLPNAIVFRTSIRALKIEKNTFILPAFVDDFVANTVPWQPLHWQPKPSISFRGLSAPLQLPLSIRARLGINQMAKNISLGWRLKTYFPEGYLMRRRALVHLLERKDLIDTDIAINLTSQGDDYRKDYLAAFNNHPYF